MPSCVVCNVYTGSKDKDATLFNFPKDAHRLHQWLVAVRSHLKPSWTVEKIRELRENGSKASQPTICSNHFSPTCCKENLKTRFLPYTKGRKFVLTEDAVPSLFGEETSRKSSESQREMRSRKQLVGSLLESTSRQKVTTSNAGSSHSILRAASQGRSQLGTAAQGRSQLGTAAQGRSQLGTAIQGRSQFAAALQGANQLGTAVQGMSQFGAASQLMSQFIAAAEGTRQLDTAASNMDTTTHEMSHMDTTHEMSHMDTTHEMSHMGTTHEMSHMDTTHEMSHMDTTTHEASGVQLCSVKETAKRKRSEDTPDAAVESLTPVYLHSQLSRWKGACNNLELTDNQMAKFLLDRYYNGDKSAAFTDRQSTDKTLILVLDQGLVTLWNNSKADKGFSSDKDFLWFLLLGPQKSGTDSEGCTVRDHGASEECVPVKVDYVGPGYTASDTSQDSNANHPLISQPPTCIPSPTQNNYITETAMITQVPVTSQNNAMQMPRHKKSRKQVLEELSQDDPVFPESFGKEGSRCDYVDTAPTQQKVGRTENHTSTSYMATQRSSNTASRAKSRKQVNPQPGPREKPAKDLGNFENTTTCSKPTSGEVGIDLKEEEELETDPSDCDHRSTTCITSQLSFGTEGIRVKQEDDNNHSISFQLSRDSAVRIKVEKEDGLEVNLSNFDKTNKSCPQLGANIKEEDKNTIDYENTNTPQLSHSTVSIKVEKEDGLEVDFGCYGNTNTSSHQSLEEELEMQLDSAIMATSKHLG